MSDITVTVTTAGSSTVSTTNGSTYTAAVGSGGAVNVSLGTTGGTVVTGTTVQVGTVSTLSAGSSATVTNKGTAYAAVLDFGIPAGSTGPAGSSPSISIGTVTTGAAGSSASVKANTVSGGVSLDFTIPAGATGATGSTSYTLPAASSTVLGGVKQGSNVTIAADGTLSVAAPVTSLAASAITGLSAVATTGSASDLSAGTIASARLPAATTSAAGAVIVGSGLAISSGVLSATGGSSYTLPAASSSVLGGVKQGSNVTIAGDGTISVAAPVTSLPYSSITGTPSLATVASTGAYADLSGKPTLGTAAAAATTDFAAASHTHALSSLTQSSATTGQVPTWNGSAWAPATPSSGGGSTSSAYVTVPSGGDPYYSSVSLLLHADGDLTDSSSSRKTVVANGGATATGSAKFGSASFALSGSSQYLSVPYSSALDLSSGNWTVECWANASTLRTSNQLFAINSDSSQYCQAGVVVNADGSAYFLCINQAGNGWINTTLAAAGTFATNAWYHVAAVRVGTQFALYVNGVSVISYTSSDTLSNLSSPTLIGFRTGSSSSSYWTGSIDEFRITKGIARYAGNFTVPGSAGASSADLTLPVTFYTPTITISSQPSNQTASSGAATFGVTASVSPFGAATYQWQKSTNSGSTWASVSGATSSLALTSLTTSNNGDQYRVIVSSDGATSVTSNAATLTVAASFTAQAVLLTSGTSYTIPSGASSMRAWVIGGGGGDAGSWGFPAGGCAYKTWSSVTGGATVTYAVGSAGRTSDGGSNADGGTSTVTYGGVTISGYGGGGTSRTGGSFGGGDGGAAGGNSAGYFGSSVRGAAVGGNSATLASCGRRPATDVSGLLAAVALAGGKTSEDCGSTAAFGSGGWADKYQAAKAAGYGGGGGKNGSAFVASGPGAVVLYFT